MDEMEFGVRRGTDPESATVGGRAANNSYCCNGRSLEVWPSNQKIEMGCGSVVAMTQFADTALYHAPLTDKVLDLESSPQHTRHFFRAAGSTKVFNLPDWGIPEAILLHARALEMFRRVLGKATAAANVSWANIFRDGDYLLPHSHRRATASIVYFLANTQTDRDDPLNGRFCIVDPRVPQCCKDEPGRMTTPWLAPSRPGMMIMFPAEVVHCVNLYCGPEPRVTIAWNISEMPIPGSPVPLAES